MPTRGCIDPTLSLSMPPTTQLRLAPSDDHHLSSILSVTSQRRFLSIEVLRGIKGGGSIATVAIRHVGGQLEGACVVWTPGPSGPARVWGITPPGSVFTLECGREC